MRLTTARVLPSGDQSAQETLANRSRGALPETETTASGPYPSLYQAAFSAQGHLSRAGHCMKKGAGQTKRPRSREISPGLEDLGGAPVPRRTVDHAFAVRGEARVAGQAPLERQPRVLQGARAGARSDAPR